MKTHSRGSYAKFVFAMNALTFLLFAIYPQSVAAQTNTFPQSGNVGIGTTSPPNPLTITRNGSTPYPSRPAYELLQLIDTTDNTPQILFGSAHNGMFLRYTSTDYASVSQRLSIFTGGLVEAFVVNNNSNVGIGTSSPLYSLDVHSSSQWAARFKKTDATHGGIIVDAATGYNPNLAMAVNGTIKWYMNSNSNSSDSLQFWETTGNFPRFTLTQAGSVGIGTANPGAGYRLDVQGGAINSSGGLCIAGDCKTTWSQVGGTSQWTTSGPNVYYQTGSVGVGTSSPAQLLHVERHQNGNTMALVKNDSTGPLAQASLRMMNDTGKLAQFGIYSSLTTPYGALTSNEAYAYSTTNLTLMADTASGHMKFATGGNTERMRIDAAGNVGIGNPNPGKKLDVTGDINASGSITGGTIEAKYQDVAEWVPSTHALPAGTVVTLDPTKSNHVEASSKAYDTRVAGVVSAQPGIALGEQAENKVLVATTGRVRIKVDASHGPIQVGDLLVSSNVPGVAMKSKPIDVGGVEIHRPGTLIGKALEPLAKGLGEILVLLSLQ